MKDTIRKAVELADGFKLSGTGETIFVQGAFGFAVDSTQPPRWSLDALAAQLVRQVDALGPLECDITAATTWIHCPSNDEASHPAIIGPDRTMNTLRAIVDSGVLTGGD